MTDSTPSNAPVKHKLVDHKENYHTKLMAVMMESSNSSTDTNLLSGIKPSSNTSYLRIMVQVDTATVFRLEISDGTTDVDVKLNSGVALVAGEAYIFDVLAPRNGYGSNEAFETTVGVGELVYNFQIATASTIEVLVVYEVVGNL